jgi:hypothetical protein
MPRKKSIIPKSKRSFNKQIKGKLIGKISEISGGGSGNALYLRPYRNDEHLIEEIAEAMDEKKSAVAQKLLHLALNSSVDERMRESRQLELLDWLITNEKHKIAERDVFNARLERLEEHSRELEKTIKQVTENTYFTRIIASEIYCIGVICMSILNQIFTKIIEYFSPNEVERNNSSDFANRNILGLLEHSISELENLSKHHELELENLDPEVLYLFTKIEKIKERLKPVSDKQKVEK